MGPLDLFTDEELMEELARRQDQKELAYLMYLGVSDADDGDAWRWMSDVTYDTLQEIYESEMDDYTDNLLYDSDNWTKDKDLEDQFNEDFEE